jgi:hypothetical protein
MCRFASFMTAATLIASAGLSISCSSKSKAPETATMSQSMAARISSVDMSKRSSFESSLVTDNTGTGAQFQKRGYNQTSDYKGNTGLFPGSKNIESNSYAGANKTSPLGSTISREAGSKARGWDKSAGTATAREQGKVSAGSGQSFRPGERAYTTRMVRDASRSQQENVRPVIIRDKTPAPTAAAPSEDDIRRMLNRK